jgi:xylulokinase
MAYVLGLDISTTGAKALIIDQYGQVIASHSTPQSLSQPHPLWSEQNPAEWWAGMLASIRHVVSQISDPAEIKGIGLTGQMHGLVCLDAYGNILRPAILWNDQRTQAECDWITETVGEKRLIALTGNRALTGFTAPKLIWVRNHEPEIYRRIAHILLPKDYIRWQLTGEYHTDLAGAAGTLLLDVKARAWSDEVLQALDIPADWLPKTHEGTQITGTVSPQAAQATGLPVGIPVVGGGGDQAAQAVGVGAVKPGVIALTVGTSGVVFAPLADYAFEPEGRLHAFCHALPGQYHFMGVMLSAAGSLQWYRDTFAPTLNFTELIAEAAEIPPGAEGLFFLPYLTGERTPHPDPLARGAFIGLTTRHTRGHLTRAVLEGISFGLCDSFTLIQASEAGKVIREIRVSGGGARSPLWLQIMADIFGAPLTVVEALEGAAYGAALLAGIGTGLWANADEATAVIQTGAVVTPGPGQTKYEEIYPLYRSLYPALKSSFAQIAHLS